MQSVARQSRNRALRSAPLRRAPGVVLLLVALGALGGCVSSPALSRLPANLPASVELSDTPFLPQTEHQCGPAALATLLGAAGHPTEPAALTAEVYLPGREGSLQTELIAAARARNLLPFETGPALEDLLAEVAAGRPVLVLQRLGLGPWPNWHYAVVIGYDQSREHVLLRSGTRERHALRAAVFEATWARAGRWGIVLLEPGELPARPELHRYMRAAADLEAQSSPSAAAAYRTAVQQWPDSALPALGLGNVAAAGGDWREAERWYRTALAAEAGNAAALNNRAEALQRLGCSAAARRALQDGQSRVATDDPLRSVLDDAARTLATVPVGEDPATCSEFTVP